VDFLLDPKKAPGCAFVRTRTAERDPDYQIWERAGAQTNSNGGEDLVEGEIPVKRTAPDPIFLTFFSDPIFLTPFFHNRVNWPRNDEEKRKTNGEIYGWSALWAGRSTFPNGEPCYTDPIWNKVKYLVWVTVEAWHVDTKNDDAPGGRFGEFRDRSVHITIYGAPEQGFEKLQDESSVYSNLLLDSRLMTRGVIKKDHDIVSMGGMLYEMCITFQDEVYFSGMKDVLDNGKFRGASGQFGTVRVLCAEICGYDRVMLEDSASYVTFQLRPGSKHMYVLGQRGTLPQIRNLVRTVVRMWREKPELRASFKPDKEVSVM